MKKRQFCPTGLDMLEDRVVMSTATAAWHGGWDHVIAVPTLTQRTFNQAAGRIDRAYQSFAGDYNRAYRQAVQQSRFIGEAAALDRLNLYAFNRGLQLSQQLYQAPAGIPYARVNISPTLQFIGENLANDISFTPSLFDAQTNGRGLIGPYWQETRLALRDIVLADLADGLYTWK